MKVNGSTELIWTASNLIEDIALARLSGNGIQLTGNNPTQLGQQIAQS